MRLFTFTLFKLKLWQAFPPQPKFGLYFCYWSKCVRSLIYNNVIEFPSVYMDYIISLGAIIVAESFPVDGFVFVLFLLV